MVRAKFEVVRNEPASADGKYDIMLSAVTGGSRENEEYWEWTPSGSFEMQTINKVVADQLEVGKEYYIDISPADGQ